MIRLSLAKRKDSPPYKKGCPEYDTKLHLMVRLQFWSWSTPSLPLLLVLLSPEVVVPVRIPCISQIDLFNKYLYLIGMCAKKTLKETNMQRKCKYVNT